MLNTQRNDFNDWGCSMVNLSLNNIFRVAIFLIFAISISVVGNTANASHEHSDQNINNGNSKKTRLVFPIMNMVVKVRQRHMPRKSDIIIRREPNHIKTR